MIDEEVRTLTKQLVRIQSINNTSGEKDIADFIEGWFRKLPYLQKHPENLIIAPIPGDPLGRKSVLALLAGERDDNNRTVLLHGHIDTVGLEGYNELAPYACDPDALAVHLADADLPDEVRKDLESGDFLFGRGSCDMKSGDAVFMVLFERFAEHPEEFSGNLVVMFNPVEENMHTGIITALPSLADLKKSRGLDFVCALNNDFTAPLYPGDPMKTIYTGIGGKVLPCFYIQGKETHVGQCFEGVDAAMLAAALTLRIQLSMDFADSYEGETCYPPSVLKMKDLKTWYNVQTIKEAFVYFNVFVHNAPMDQITKRLLACAEDAFREVIDRINKEEERFCGLSGEEFHAVTYEPLVLTYEELKKKAEEKAGKEKVETELSALVKEKQAMGTDAREVGIALVRRLLQISGINRPAIVLYFAPPYCPHSTLKEDEKDLLAILKEAAEEETKTSGTAYRFLHFYPSLSDSSYLKIDDDDASIHALTDNFPAFETLYPLPVDRIRELSIPAVNIGCFGADCHKWTERVNMPYTFGVLPHLEKTMITKLLERRS
ncbi:MAG: M20/M25/M40 family metallo-hydrolase [Lachnospiraceae bacterium]|jgi:arginine utilization protein RocB